MKKTISIGHGTLGTETFIVFCLRWRREDGEGVVQDKEAVSAALLR